MKSAEISNPVKCPLCGEDNSCQNICDDTNIGSAAEENKNCWCKNVKFPKQLLEAVPAEAKNKACICKRCATRSAG